MYLIYLLIYLFTFRSCDYNVLRFIQKFTDVPYLLAYLFIYLFTVRSCDYNVLRFIQKFTDVLIYLFICLQFALVMTN